MSTMSDEDYAELRAKVGPIRPPEPSGVVQGLYCLVGIAVLVLVIGLGNYLLSLTW